MKIKHLASALLLATGLAFAAPAVGAQLGFADTIATVSAANEGWNTDANGKFYVKNGSRLTGLQTIDGATYYFSPNGYSASGSVRLGDTTYFFKPSDGKLATGFQGLALLNRDSNEYYYFHPSGNGTLLTQQWVTHNGGRYYADATGKVTLGTIRVGKKLYHVTTNGVMKNYGRSSYDGKYYYPKNKKGVLKTGLQKINGNYYYFNTLTGQRQTGYVQIGNDTYFFAKSNGAAKRNTWAKIKDSTGTKRRYYFDSSGRRATGWKTISGKKYYLDPKADGARAENGWYKIGQHFYYFNSKGVMQSGFITVNGKTYYSLSNGVRRKGWQTVNGRKYYMKKKNGVMKTGWFSYKGKKYYLNPVKTSSTYGAAKVGWAQIGGSWYYFNNDGAMRTGWLIENAKYYYFDKTTGKMYKGRHTIDGKVYDFGTQGYIATTPTGEWRVEVNRKKCFVVVYRGTTPVKAFVCSTARDGVSTPTGTFRIMDKLRWHELMGPSWGQYCSHITSDILFHSVPNTRPYDNHSLNASAYNMLGQPASAGCIRLTVGHAKWMYDNVPTGTRVIVSDSVATPKYVTIEQAQKIPLNQNYDPTDPNA